MNYFKAQVNWWKYLVSNNYWLSILMFGAIYIGTIGAVTLLVLFMLEVMK